MFQETKIYRKGKIRLDNYCIFESIRGDGEGGGLLTMVHNNFEPVLIPSSNTSKISSNILVVEANLGKSRIRYINGYGVQENAPMIEKMEFLTSLDQEVENSFNNNCFVCIQMDGNGKFGNEVITGDPHEISQNGRLLLDLVIRKSLVIVNATDKCRGVITRMRVKGNKIEKSVLDYFIVCQDLYALCLSLLVDEERRYVLKRYYKKKEVAKVVKSDHNPLFLYLNIPWNMHVRNSRKEIFNLRNKECQAVFYQNTSNTEILSRCLDNRDVVTGGKHWLKNLKTVIHSSFRKIRISNKKEDIYVQKLFSGRNPNLEDTEVDNEIAEKIYERNRNLIFEQINEMTDSSGNMSRIKMWKIKQKVNPKHMPSVPVAKIDERGNLVCNQQDLKDLYVSVYKDRLRHRSISQEYLQMKENKEYLFSLRVKLAKNRQTDDWTEIDLLDVMKQLKVRKATDPVGLVSELFKPGVAGSDLINSTLTLCNMMKKECKIPKFVELTDITSIYKNKGSKQDLNNDRGIFSVTQLRSIVDKLVYNDVYDIIDANMSDSNVGGRKNRSIRDNLFIVYGIINNAVNNKKNVDLSLYDIAKCFDAQWYEETMNDLWDVGVRDDRFALIGEMNSKCNIAIKTPVGITSRFQLERIEMQGTVMGPIKASIQLDTLGRDCYERQEGLYLYNDCVSVPPLMMIDDLVSFSNCGPESIVTNAIINSKIESKKLEFGPSKCFNMHIGPDEVSCQELKVHKNNIIKKNHETYLGDVICSSGTNTKNIENKCNGGIGTVSQIIAMLGQITLGHYYFEVAMVLRDSMLISKLVSSSEIWYNVTKDQYRKIEQIDEMYLMRLFQAPKSVPRLSLYVECGKVPVKFIIQSRRMMYYWHLMHLDKDELIYKFYVAQCLRPGKNDWALQILADKKDLNLDISDEEMRNISKTKFQKILQSRIKENAAKYLSKTQLRQSKTKHLKISEKFIAARYLHSKSMCTEEISTLFKLRSRTIDVKDNRESSHRDNMWCRTCQLFPESQQHLFQCSVIRKKFQSVDFTELNYEMIFGNLENQEKFTKIYHLMLLARNDILDEKKKSSPSEMEDPCTS